MSYKAKNVDTDKALEYISQSIYQQRETECLEAAKVQKYYEGIRKGLDIAKRIFECSNFEKKQEPTYSDGVSDFVYELGKELDIPTQDLRDNFSSVDFDMEVMHHRFCHKNIKKGTGTLCKELGMTKKEYDNACRRAMQAGL